MQRMIWWRFVAMGLLLVGSQLAWGTEIDVDFGKTEPGDFLRLNMGSTGWTHGGLSQYYDDLAVSYRRMDHWNNWYGPVRRRPDGGLWYDFWTLDHAIYDGTGGFHFKPYPTVDYSPACLTTEFRCNPMQFHVDEFHGQLTPAGTIIVSGKDPRVGETAGTGMFELNRKGVVVWRAEHRANFFVTPSNRLIINQADGSYSVLDAARREIGAGQGVALQQVNDKSLLVRRDGTVQLVGPDDKAEKKWPSDVAGGQVLWTRHGLLEVTADSLLLHGEAGAKPLHKSAVKYHSTWVACNAAGRILFAWALYTDRWSFGAAAFDETAKQLWQRDDIQADAIRGAAVTTAGDFILSTVGPINVTCFDTAGEVKWRVNDAGE